MESNWRIVTGLTPAVVMAVCLSPAWGVEKPRDNSVSVNSASDVVSMDGTEGMEARGRAVSPGEPSARELRDPNAYADGFGFGPMPRPRFADEQRFAFFLVDRLEGVRTSEGSTWAYDLQGWYGRDYDRLVWKAEGDADGGTLQEARTEVLWGHAVAPFWDVQLGARYDSGIEPDRGWLAVGFQGMAPHWLEIDATAYLGDAGRAALRLDAEYELLFTQRLVLQPRLEANFYGRDDPARGLGAGLSDLAAGIRLRYEIRREIAPYVGLEWSGRYGGAADYARAAGDSSAETRWVAGMRLWF